MVLQKWPILWKKNQFSQECLKSCEKTDKKHINLLVFRRRRVPNAVYEMKDELQEYFQKIKGKNLPFSFKKKKWIIKLAYLVFIT